MSRRIISLIICISFLFTQTGFAQAAAVELNLSGYFARMGSNLNTIDSFRPIHLRYFSYDSLNNSFKVLLDKGDQLKKGLPGAKGLSPKGTVPEVQLKQETQLLLNYFLIGVTLPNDTFWVNLRPDSPDNIIDSKLELTDIGKVMLESDLQLKKDTSSCTSPNTIEGRQYWDKLYKKAAELYGTDTVTIPTLTRPWIVPGEIIVRETKDSAYIYKATLKVMLESDYLKKPGDASMVFQSKEAKTTETSPSFSETSPSFSDSRSKALNDYSTQLIKELIIPKLTKEVNTSKRYAPLRQVYYSLILSRWFKSRFADKQGLSPKGTDPAFISLIDSSDLTNLTSKTPWSKDTYFNAYKRSFAEGEYNIKEPTYTPTGQVIRSYFSGGIAVMGNNLAIPQKGDGASSAIGIGIVHAAGNVLMPEALSQIGPMFSGNAGSALDSLYNIGALVLQRPSIPEKAVAGSPMLNNHEREHDLAVAIGLRNHPKLNSIILNYLSPFVEAYNENFQRYPTLKEARAFYERIDQHAERNYRDDDVKEYVRMQTAEFISTGRKILTVPEEFMRGLAKISYATRYPQLARIKELMLGIARQFKEGDLSPKDAVVSLNAIYTYFTQPGIPDYRPHFTSGVLSSVLNNNPEWKMQSVKEEVDELNRIASIVWELNSIYSESEKLVKSKELLLWVFNNVKIILESCIRDAFVKSAVEMQNLEDEPEFPGTFIDKEAVAAFMEALDSGKVYNDKEEPVLTRQEVEGIYAKETISILSKCFAEVSPKEIYQVLKLVRESGSNHTELLSAFNLATRFEILSVLIIDNIDSPQKPGIFELAKEIRERFEEGISRETIHGLLEGSFLKKEHWLSTIGIEIDGEAGPREAGSPVVAQINELLSDVVFYAYQTNVPLAVILKMSRLDVRPFEDLQTKFKLGSISAADTVVELKTLLDEHFGFLLNLKERDYEFQSDKDEIQSVVNGYKNFIKTINSLGASLGKPATGEAPKVSSSAIEVDPARLKVWLGQNGITKKESKVILGWINSARNQAKLNPVEFNAALKGFIFVVESLKTSGRIYGELEEGILAEVFYYLGHDNGLTRFCQNIAKQEPIRGFVALNDEERDAIVKDSVEASIYHLLNNLTGAVKNDLYYWPRLQEIAFAINSFLLASVAAGPQQAEKDKSASPVNEIINRLKTYFARLDSELQKGMIRNSVLQLQQQLWDAKDNIREISNLLDQAIPELTRLGFETKELHFYAQQLIEFLNNRGELPKGASSAVGWVKVRTTTAAAEFKNGQVINWKNPNVSFTITEVPTLDNPDVRGVINASGLGVNNVRCIVPVDILREARDNPGYWQERDLSNFIALHQNREIRAGLQAQAERLEPEEFLTNIKLARIQLDYKGIFRKDVERYMDDVLRRFFPNQDDFEQAKSCFKITRVLFSVSAEFMPDRLQTIMDGKGQAGTSASPVPAQIGKGGAVSPEGSSSAVVAKLTAEESVQRIREFAEQYSGEDTDEHILDQKIKELKEDLHPMYAERLDKIIRKEAPAGSVMFTYSIVLNEQELNAVTDAMPETKTSLTIQNSINILRDNLIKGLRGQNYPSNSTFPGNLVRWVESITPPFGDHGPTFSGEDTITILKAFVFAANLMRKVDMEGDPSQYIREANNSVINYLSGMEFKGSLSIKRKDQIEERVLTPFKYIIANKTLFPNTWTVQRMKQALKALSEVVQTALDIGSEAPKSASPVTAVEEIKTEFNTIISDFLEQGKHNPGGILGGDFDQVRKEIMNGIEAQGIRESAENALGYREMQKVVSDAAGIIQLVIERGGNSPGVSRWLGKFKEDLTVLQNKAEALLENEISPGSLFGLPGKDGPRSSPSLRSGPAGSKEDGAAGSAAMISNEQYALLYKAQSELRELLHSSKNPAVRDSAQYLTLMMGNMFYGNMDDVYSGLRIFADFCNAYKPEDNAARNAMLDLVINEHSKEMSSIFRKGLKGTIGLSLNNMSIGESVDYGRLGKFDNALGEIGIAVEKYLQNKITTKAQNESTAAQDDQAKDASSAVEQRLISSLKQKFDPPLTEITARKILGLFLGVYDNTAFFKLHLSLLSERIQEAIDRRVNIDPDELKQSVDNLRDEIRIPMQKLLDILLINVVGDIGDKISAPGTAYKKEQLKSAIENLASWLDENTKNLYEANGITSPVDKLTAASSIVPKAPGGISFRPQDMIIKYEPMGSLQGLNFKLPTLSYNDLQKINLAVEAKQINQMIDGGIAPSGERIKEFLAACCQKQELSGYQGEVAVWLVEACRLDEQEARDSTPELKEAIVILENVAA